MTPSFIDLAQRLECGDAEAAALLFDRYAPRLIGLAPGTAGSPKHGRQRNVLLHRTT
jgi:hypothetical protein